METLICTKCRMLWGQAILQQLDLSSGSSLPSTLTHITCVCAMWRNIFKILYLLCKDMPMTYSLSVFCVSRSWGTTPAQIIGQLKENHSKDCKLTGPAKCTSQWLTSVCNKVVQVLISLTASGGPALDLMSLGLVNR